MHRQIFLQSTVHFSWIRTVVELVKNLVVVPIALNHVIQAESKLLNFLIQVLTQLCSLVIFFWLLLLQNV